MSVLPYGFQKNLLIGLFHIQQGMKYYDLTSEELNVADTLSSLKLVGEKS